MNPALLSALRQIANNLPSLGDSSKTYPVILTEPEINAIHAAYGFMRDNLFRTAQLAPAALEFTTKFWNHYGPTLTALSERLAQFDDDQLESKPQ